MQDLRGKLICRLEAVGAVNDRRIDTRCAYGAREGINCEFVVEAASGVKFERISTTRR